MSKGKLLTPAQREAFLKVLRAGKLDRSVYPGSRLDLAYGDSPWQAMDLYLPESGAGPFPTIVFIHGGGWEGGSKDDTQVMPFLRCLPHGWAVVSLEFRPIPHAIFPDNLYDIKRALRCLGETGKSYGLDPMRLVMAGASAGAQLALMAAYTVGIPVYEGGPITDAYRIIGAIDQFGVTDFLSFDRQFAQSGCARFDDPEDPAPSSEDKVMGVACRKIPNLVRFACPLEAVHRAIPPTLIQHGRYDPMVPFQQSTELAARIEAVAGPDRVRLCINEDCTHGDPKFGEGDRLREILDFLDSL